VIRSGKNKFPLEIEVEIDGECVPSIPLLALFHKPKNVHSVMRDPWGRETLEELSLEWPFLKSMHPVGRLDADTSGLLLFSSDGQLTQTLLHPSSEIPRVYEARVLGTVKPGLKDVLAKGVKTSEGVFSADLLDFQSVTDKTQLAEVAPSFDDEGKIVREVDSKGRLGAVEEGASSSVEAVVDCYSTVQSTVMLCVTEGKYRMVRRILHNAGHSVLELHRVSYGAIELGDIEEGDLIRASPDVEDWARGLLQDNSD
jgi:23S rRNA pseudouridine2605 synthase